MEATKLEMVHEGHVIQGGRIVENSKLNTEGVYYKQKYLSR